MKILAATLFLTALSGCWNDESVGAYGAANRIWVLSELDGAPFVQRATLTFPDSGTIAGKAPCNSYSGAMTAPYPWFEAKNLAVTRMACPDLAAESQFLSALSDMNLSEVAGNILILSTDSGREMVFKASE
ncbi:MAG: META domain-containing protein [Rhodobacteraceae bacterium]|nr:MAG: META domain-containing protein [Paracoccaceae bacterium]